MATRSASAQSTVPAPTAGAGCPDGVATAEGAGSGASVGGDSALTVLPPWVAGADDLDQVADDGEEDQQDRGDRQGDGDPVVPDDCEHAGILGCPARRATFGPLRRSASCRSAAR